MIYITGDTHRSFDRLFEFHKRYRLVKDDVMIILGDAGINFYGWASDTVIKQNLQKLPFTLFCIHGNHEERPQSIESYKIKKWHEGTVYYETEYPNLLFAVDGEVYDFDGNKTLVIGGAYSVDKAYRVRNNYPWFRDEQPSQKVKDKVEAKIKELNNEVDIVLSHTVPYQYRPIDTFSPYVNQSSVDSSTELWLEDIEIDLKYKKWYGGHYHIDRRVDDSFQIMYGRVEKLLGEENDFYMI